MNLFGYTYKIYDIGYKTEMTSKECNSGDPLETPGGLYRGPPSNGRLSQEIIHWASYILTPESGKWFD